jgi:hypothetical protein
MHLPQPLPLFEYNEDVSKGSIPYQGLLGCLGFLEVDTVHRFNVPRRRTGQRKLK